MSRPVRSISCFSNDEKLRNVFRSIIRVYTQLRSTGLRHEWVYCEQDGSGIDVQILDLDEEHNWQRFTAHPHMIVIAISKHPELLAGQKYTLGKPLHSNSLLRILQNIEGAEPIVPVMAQTLVADNGTAGLSEFSLGGRDAAPAMTEAQDADRLFKLQSWPDMTAMPEEKLLDISRVCALLSIRPASLGFMSDFLEIPPPELESILSLIRSKAYADFPSVQDAPRQLQAVSETPRVETKKPDRPSSFLSKIWNRLKGAA